MAVDPVANASSLRQPETKKAEKHLNAPAVRNLTAKKRWPKF